MTLLALPSRVPCSRRAGLLAAILILASLALPGMAQIPDTLKHTVAAPPTGAQLSAQLGSCVAVEGPYVVAGAPGDSTNAPFTGVVKVFNANTGALLHVLENPFPEQNDAFGRLVAMSGTRLVVGNSYDKPGGVNSGSAFVYDLASATPTVPIAGLNNPDPRSSEFFGGAVAISGSRVVVSAHDYQTNTYTGGIVYVYDLDSASPSIPVATLPNPTQGSFDRFGSAVAISGTRVVVGTSSSGGSAYLYDLAGPTPTLPIATFNNPVPGGSGFAAAIAITGDRVVIGNPGDNTGAQSAGSIAVYDLASATPTVPVTTLRKQVPVYNDMMGARLALSGTLVITGKAVVYDVASPTPNVPVAALQNPAPAYISNFGSSVAISGTRAIVGDPAASAPSSNSGAAYIYDLAGATPTVAVTTLSHTGPAPNDFFGGSVAVSGNLMVVASHLDDTKGVDAGAAYVYDLTSATPDVPLIGLYCPNPVVEEHFASAVAISGTRVAVACRESNVGAMVSGSVYVYDLASSTPAIPVATLHNPFPAYNDQFGSSIAIDGARLVVGASLDSSGAEQAGSIYVYDLESATATTPVLTVNSTRKNSVFGGSVGISGTRVIVGAKEDNTDGLATGRAYVYDLAAVTPAIPVSTLRNPEPTITRRFGAAVSISGTRVAIGANASVSGLASTIRAYAYDLAGATPLIPMATFYSPESGNQGYANHVAISGTRVVVSAETTYIGSFRAGRVFVYDVASPASSVPVAMLDNPTPRNEEYFGYSVAIDGLTVVVGTPGDNPAPIAKGSTYVYIPANLQTLAANPIGTSTATFNGSVNPDGHVTSVRYEWGLSPGLGNATADQAVGSGSNYLLAPELMAGLTPGATYSFRIRAEDDTGVRYGATLQFTTLTLLQAWKLAYLGNVNASDFSDPDRDGLLTILEYGLATLPNAPSARPVAEVYDYPDGRRLRIVFQRDPEHSDVTVQVQAASMLSGPWTAVATSTLGAPFNGPGYVSGDDATPGIKTVEVRDTVNVSDVPQRFLRVLVTH